jgi:ribosomal 50S subunit-recycling heat shock protein
MRLDKFLKMTRLVKRRTLANALCDKGHASLNGKVAKASTTVKVGDDLTVRYGHKVVAVKVLGLPTKALGTQAQAEAFLEPIGEATPTLAEVVATLDAMDADTDEPTP